MPVTVNGTNGLLQNYATNTPTTGFSYTVTTPVTLFTPSGTLASGTVVMPASPSDGMTVTITSTQTITALTISGNTGQSVTGAATTLDANASVTYIYRASNANWYPFATGANPAQGGVVTLSGTQTLTNKTINGGVLQSGTTQTPTSSTTVPFTSIPSWVKRITLMYSGMKTNSTSPIIVQIGAGSYTATGYAGQVNHPGTAGSGMSTGFMLTNGATSARVWQGTTVLTLIGSNIWAETGILADSANTINPGISGGSLSLGGTLDRVQVTTVNGTDTFTAGSINILYE